MRLIGITYKGPAIDDEGTFREIPEDLKKVLQQINGAVSFKGGFHLRGCCNEPAWHSINEVWTGKHAFWKVYPDILDIDVPFAQDCMGDQFLLRQNKIIKLMAETGEVEETGLTLSLFFEEIEKDPVGVLGLHPLIQFEMEGGKLEPGFMLQAYPPFSMKTSEMEMSLKAIPALDHLNYLKEVYKNRRKLDDEGIQFLVGD